MESRSTVFFCRSCCQCWWPKYSEGIKILQLLYRLWVLRLIAKAIQFIFVYVQDVKLLKGFWSHYRWWLSWTWFHKRFWGRVKTTQWNRFRRWMYIFWYSSRKFWEIGRGKGGGRWRSRIWRKRTNNSCINRKPKWQDLWQKTFLYVL